MKRIKKLLLILLLALMLSGIVLAVPAAPESELYGTEEGECGSESFELVDMDSLPDYHPVSAAKCDNWASLPQPASGSKKYLPLLVIVVGLKGGTDEGGYAVSYDNNLDWNDIIFSSENSLKSFYNDMSFGKFTFEPAAETCAYKKKVVTNKYDKAQDGIVHVNVNHDHLLYNMSTIQQAGNGTQFGWVLYDAIEQASAYVDFASFDTNDAKST